MNRRADESDSLEAKVKFNKTGFGEYAVYTDALDGATMQFIGYVQKVDRPLLDNARWQARVKGKSVGYGRTRLDAVDRLLGVTPYEELFKVSK
jgi:hypothetical protein